MSTLDHEHFPLSVLMIISHFTTSDSPLCLWERIEEEINL